MAVNKLQSVSVATEGMSPAPTEDISSVAKEVRSCAATDLLLQQKGWRLLRKRTSVLWQQQMSSAATESMHSLDTEGLSSVATEDICSFAT